MKYNSRKRKGQKEYVDARRKADGTFNNVRITRDSDIVAEICKSGAVLNCTARVKEVSYKYGHDNILLQHIVFTYDNTEYYIEHCWLQEQDYPTGFYESVKEGWKYYFQFEFYKYRDAVDRGMHGMTIHYAEIY